MREKLDTSAITDKMVEAFAFWFYGGNEESLGCCYTTAHVDDVREDIRRALAAALRAQEPSK